MSYEAKAKKIRKKLTRYTKVSVLKAILNRLHAKAEGIDEMRKMPWICFLAIEWLFQVKQSNSAVEASERDVYRILNDIWNLQGDALKLKDNQSIMLALRAMLISQMRCQTSEVIHMYTLSRLYYLTFQKKGTSAMREDFQHITGIPLQEFFVFLLWVICSFKDDRYYIKYEELITNMHPYYNVERIAKLLLVLGGDIAELHSMLEKGSESRNGPKNYFDEPLLLDMPILLLPEGVAIFHTSVLNQGASEFVMRTLKSENIERFRKKFTPGFERYIEIVLNERDAKFITEGELDKLYKENSIEGKVVDFIYQSESGEVFIDAKGVEPHAKLLTSDNSRIIKDKLKVSYIKGMTQAAECAAILDKISSDISPDKDKRFALVVTNQDFYFGSGNRLINMLDESIGLDVLKELGDSFKIENVHFCSVEDFEGIMYACEHSRKSLPEFLAFCNRSDSNPHSMKFCMRQHIEEFCEHEKSENNSPIGSALLVKEQGEIFDKVEEMITTSTDHWRKGEKMMQEYLFAVQELKRRVLSRKL